MPKTNTKSPEHREKLQKALKAYWAKKRKAEAGGGKVPAKAKATKAKSKAAAKPPSAPPADKPAEQVLIHRGLWNLIRLYGFPNVHAELLYLKARLEELATEGR